jgi:hypothetical protein
MEFISEFSTNLWKDYCIFIIVCTFYKRAALIPCNITIDFSKDVKFLSQHVWGKFVLPLTIIYDCDYRFLSHIWKKILNIFSF